ncbi:hypothetical protein PHJA_001161500 [Phtheirospermum japonicum]|uniref:Glycine-rich protein n=1 Tax=Phtheirospermum japonicum TaxID=374723 RepID=A0A830BTQ6_9LAMI|nr:hypothetical protein PHJA_001161500 [Phtheirospermum japonicum]
MAIKIVFLVAIVAFAAAVNGRALPADKNAADLQAAFYHFHFPRHGGFRGGAGIGFGGVAGRPRTGGFTGRGGGSSFDGGAGTGDDGSLKSGGGGKRGGGTVDDGVEGGLVPLKPSIEKTN